MSAGLADWNQTWTELGASAPDERLYERLIACWSEEHRHYHTLQHLHECLAQFDHVRQRALRPGEVALALWFHDAVYDPQRGDNEALSAQWARTSVLDAGLPLPTAERLHDMIMATRHKQAPLEADTQLLVDIDLSILGADPRRFDESDAQIRAEYAHVPDEEFRQGRRRFLGDMLARPRLYSTDHFYQALEQRARSNLARALARLDT